MPWPSSTLPAPPVVSFAAKALAELARAAAILVLAHVALVRGLIGAPAPAVVPPAAAPVDAFIAEGDRAYRTAIAQGKSAGLAALLRDQAIEWARDLASRGSP